MPGSPFWGKEHEKTPGGKKHQEKGQKGKTDVRSTLIEIKGQKPECEKSARKKYGTKKKRGSVLNQTQG